MGLGVFGADNRSLVLNTAAEPYRSVAYVSVVFPDGTSGWGTGSIVGRNDVLTAGHVLYDADHGGYATQVTVTPASQGGSAPYGVITSTHLDVNSDFVNNRTYDSDFGLITTATNIGDSTGWMAIGGTVSSGSTISTAGYPSDRYNGTGMIAETGHVAGTTSTRVIFDSDIDGYFGQSGSAVWTTDAAHGTRSIVSLFDYISYTTNIGPALTGLNYLTVVGWTMSNDAMAPHKQGPSSDFDGDGRSDIVLKYADGAVNVELLSATGSSKAMATLLGTGNGLTPTEVGDLNGDGHDDILFTGRDGSVVVSFMNGVNIAGATTLLGGNSGFSLREAADFNGDGKADLLWQHTDGTVIMWTMNGSTVAGSTILLAGGTGQTVREAADFNGDGKADILFQGADGSASMWLMDGSNVLQKTQILGAGSGFVAREAGDLNGDGFDDILWQHRDGTVLAWFMNGSGVAGISTLMAAGSGYTPKDVADYNGDGYDDVLWQHQNGSSTILYMHGANAVALASVTGATTIQIATDAWA